ncbi:hypothetical protein FIM12_02780 [SAR202 cluster bacterium AD-804-J14_MRT_500m]|nr:hypothetical protein [SAR202 cluster bacterium AD-804-J14_MRT_500m]
MTTDSSYIRRIYPLSPRELSEEQMAVVCAMTSRRPEPFDEIAQRVTSERAADFHERWVLGYGHASVAEHAIIHMAVENISRLACDSLEDNRLASYTEKSSRYQVLEAGYYHVPSELGQFEEIRSLYVDTCDRLFQTYESLVKSLTQHLAKMHPQREGERDSAYNLRLRRQSIDSCRFILPAATLTNVAVTMNARSMEHAITKLLTSDLAEERDLAGELKVQGRLITPTLIKYADANPYLSSVRENQSQHNGTNVGVLKDSYITARLVHYDLEAEIKLGAALAYRYSNMAYQQAWDSVKAMALADRSEFVSTFLQGLGPHDAPPREFELVDYTFELVMDYGAYREFKRHRIQTYIPQPLTVIHGILVPPLVQDAGLEDQFSEEVHLAENVFRRISESFPVIAPYLVTHAHLRRLITKANLRECYHLFKLRTQAQAHFSIRDVMDQALHLVVDVHPQLFRYLPLRDLPDWWPFTELPGP